MLKPVQAIRAGACAKRLKLVAILAFGASLAAIGSASANPGTPGVQPPAPGQGEQPGPRQSAENEVQQTLAKYGEFLKHEKYGDVWKPTQVAPGWRPYEPCHWVYNQEMKSWFFDDRTEWGAIVHHYGRWTLDPQQGWLWIPGSEFGPGWVAWEMRGDQVGWAPLPPDQDAAFVRTAAFTGDPNLWTFVAFASLGKGCGGDTPPPPRPRVTAPAAPTPMPAAVGGGYVAGGYLPPRIVIVHGCHSHPRWCHYWPGRDWRWPRPHHPGGHRPGDHAGCAAAWCAPGRPGGTHIPGRPPGPDQKCGIFGQFCKPGPQAGGRPPFSTTCRASWCAPGAMKPHFPRPFPQVGHRPHVPNRFVNAPPHFNNRFTMRQPRFNHRPMRFQQRSFAPRQSFSPRMASGGHMRFAGNGGRRR